jgi:peptidylprolyl isomerase/FKBP-type peptidyl-prolyl cis-trans isomerase FklB
MTMRLLAMAAAAAALLVSTAACSQPIQPKAAPQANPTEFLAGNALEPGVKSLPSGLQYKVVKSGPAGGAHPTLEDQVTVNYAAILLDGTVIDSSYERNEPASFQLRGLVPAWEQALPLMVPGDEWLLWAPPALAYGAEGKGPVPPNSVLQFRIELVRVN